jgi:signal transduction histidine kinase
LVVADPKKLYEKSDPPATLLTQVRVDDQVVAQYNSILPAAAYNTGGILSLPMENAAVQLPPGHRSVEFRFTAFDYNAPENIQFRHQLTSVDDVWADSGTVRSVVYPRLEAGKCAFSVEACGSDGDWSRTSATVNLDVAPFFWRTWWFELLVGVAFTGGVIAIVRYVSFHRLRAQLLALEQQAALQRERARIAKDIHDDLGGTLTQIAFLGELANQDRDEPNAVGERIRKISASARQAVKSLDEIVWAVNPRNDTLAHLLDYSGQYAVDYLRLIGIRCRLDYPVEIPERELSTDLRHNLFLVVKEALHNIFKHANASEVWMRVTADARALQIVVEDNGKGFALGPGDALADGLRNMQQRMADIGGDFRVESTPGAGTKIFLRLPWPAAE